MTWQEALSQEDVMGISVGVVPASDAASLSWFAKGASVSPSAIANEALKYINRVKALNGPEKGRDHAEARAS